MDFDPRYNPFSLVGKTVLITGASSGIGRETAIECSKLGARCFITARNEERLQETMSQLVGDGHEYIVADLSTQEGIDEVCAQVSALDGVVNNAGVNRRKPMAFIKGDDLDYIFHTNTYAPILVIKSLLKKKKIANGASLVFTSSVASMSSDFGNAMYGASKSALTSYMHYCARELADKGIRANTVHPGMVETNLIHSGAVAQEDLEKDMLRYPLKRYGRPQEIAHMMIYLLSDASSWVTGQSFVIDGGITLK